MIAKERAKHLKKKDWRGASELLENLIAYALKHGPALQEGRLGDTIDETRHRIMEVCVTHPSW